MDSASPKILSPCAYEPYPYTPFLALSERRSEIHEEMKNLVGTFVENITEELSEITRKHTNELVQLLHKKSVYKTHCRDVGTVVADRQLLYQFHQRQERLKMKNGGASYVHTM